MFYLHRGEKDTCFPFYADWFHFVCFFADACHGSFISGFEIAGDRL